MVVETVAITHTAEGIRFNWPDSTSTVFANQIYLAEAYAVAVHVREMVLASIITGMAEPLNKITGALEKLDSPTEDIEKLRTLLSDAASALS